MSICEYKDKHCNNFVEKKEKQKIKINKIFKNEFQIIFV